VFGFAVGESRTLAGFRRSYNATVDETLSPGGFHQRLMPAFAEYLCDLADAVLDKAAVLDTMAVDIDRFRDVMVADGKVLRLPELLSKEFEPRRGSRASATPPAPQHH
jgi:IS4 transposase